MNHCRPAFRVGTLQDRVSHAYRVLVLIRAAAHTHPEEPIDPDALLEAIGALADEAATALEPIRHTPAEISNWTPA